MSLERLVSVVVVDQNLEEKGILANAAFVVGLSAGRVMPDSTFGPDVVDGAGSVHRSLTNIGHFVRKAGQGKLRKLKEECEKEPQISVFDYPEDAAPSDYQEYSKNIATRKGEEINYRAIHLFGPESLVIPKTKNLSRL